MRKVYTPIEIFKGGPKYAVQITVEGSDLDGLMVTRLTDKGPEIILYDTLEEAKDAAAGFTEGATEIIEYRYRDE